MLQKFDMGGGLPKGDFLLSKPYVALHQVTTGTIKGLIKTGNEQEQKCRIMFYYYVFDMKIQLMSSTEKVPTKICIFQRSFFCFSSGYFCIVEILAVTPF